jgi:hypothetical protein
MELQQQLKVLFAVAVANGCSMRSAVSRVLSGDAPITGATVVDLAQLKVAFDAACRELGVGLAGLDVQKREILVKRAMGIAHRSVRATKA